jgi:hypothetical protein
VSARYLQSSIEVQLVLKPGNLVICRAGGKQMRSNEDSRYIGADSESSTGLQKGSGDEKRFRPCRAAKRFEMSLTIA